jgi:hypothetical protein
MQLAILICTMSLIMDITPFNITYMNRGILVDATIRPCCKEDNVFDYAVWIKDKLAFTITKDAENATRWVVALKNADDEFDEEMIQNIGTAIQKRISN